MSNMIYKFLKYSILFFYGGGCYICLELLFRGRSDVTMFFCGAISFVLIGLLNNFISWDMSLAKQGLIGGLFIVTPLEYLFGIIFNQDYHIWDYREQFLNLNGQICIGFSILWCLISIICVIIDDYLRYFIFNEQKPKYKFLEKKLKLTK